MTSISSVSPQNPSDVVLSFPATDAAGVTRALTACRGIQKSWSAAAAPARADALTTAAARLRARASEVASLVCREVGKPILEARGEVARGISILRYCAQQALLPHGVSLPTGQGLLITQRRPRGVAGLITPWNFPVAIPLWKAAPALAAGCAAIVKPAPEATAVALLLAEVIALEAFMVLPGDAETAGSLIDGADVVSFTGSTAAGRAVVARAGARLTPVQAEMGGCNATIVTEHADLELAARDVAASAFGFAGQKCTATQRVIACAKISEDFRAALTAATERLVVGDPASEATHVGPVINERAVGRNLEHGGRRDPGADGYFLLPTLVAASAEPRLMADEVFGPTAAFAVADDLDAAVGLANDGGYGLVTSVYTRRLDEAVPLLSRLGAGMVKVNQPTTGVDFHAPFGGEDSSSYGPREQGPDARDHYTWVQTATIGA